MKKRVATLPALTVGHSARTLEDFLDLLRVHGVNQVIDVRKMPGSTAHPHFNHDSLSAALKKAGIDYVHVPALGGLRRRRTDSPNGGWRNRSFQGYADYMQTEEFELGLQVAIASASRKRVALMCAEAVPWRCHRSLIADALVARGIPVEHIMSPTRRRPHTLRPFVRVRGTNITYPPEAEGQLSRAMASSQGRTSSGSGRASCMTTWPSRKNTRFGQTLTWNDRPSGRPLPSSTLI